ncbi:glycosyltransferase family 2 protein [Haloactinomyces albus]|uniref:Glycosyltransferase 2-like domain-containing protein n=1 Tax=Haloactinomyces albus TaxID=1352928 RepID=A0AAE3ZAS9_9ACTN|nr:glycosyltransferase family 2 protein [Haloactinomyces albus]MDR7300470.1 hypothetical protein [Haloactinomyces albus]
MTPTLTRGLRHHWLMVVLVLGGIGLRVVVELAYQPALLYIDSYRYLQNLGAFFPGGLNPIGYELLLLGPLLLIGDLGFVVLVQHLLGLALAIAIYVLLLRLGCRRWIAALAAAPVLLDAYQLQIEHLIMSDLLFQILLLVAVILLTWRGTPGPRLAAVAGVVLATSVIVRLVGVALVVPAAVFVLLAAGLRPRDGWKRRLLSAGALAAGFVAVLFGYAMYHMIWTGVPALSTSTGSVLYGRTAVVAECEKLDLTPEERRVCPDEPIPQRKLNGIDYYVHYFHNEDNVEALPEGFDYSAVQHSFAVQVILNQPFDVLGGVLQDFLKGFAPTRTQSPGDVPLSRWQFQTSYPMYGQQPEYVAKWLERYDDGTYSVNEDLAGFLRTYQLGGGYAPGTVLGAALLIAGAAVLGLGRARRSGLRAVCLLPAGMAVTVLMTAAALEFSWRYQLPGLVLLPVAGALGITAITGRRPPDSPGPVTNTTATTASPKENTMAPNSPDEVDRAALDDYAERYGGRRFAPVVVLIAAYNEEEALGGVLDGMPATSCGFDVDTLVVVDGATDNTGEVALRHGAQTCTVPANRGQGAALRLGYRLAAERGARYVVTTDADGQYDIAELPKLLQPLIEDEADFVTGSRRLGSSETTDSLRRAGTYVFAWLVSALTGQRVTDTSFGFRAMKVEVAAAVRLEQPQYQSSELLVGILAHKYRVLEQPMTMHARTAGHSKKGNNLFYGYRYAKVVFTTWLRERRTRSHTSGATAVGTVTESAPAIGER